MKSDNFSHHRLCSSVWLERHSENSRLTTAHSVSVTVARAQAILSMSERITSLPSLRISECEVMRHASHTHTLVVHFHCALHYNFFFCFSLNIRMQRCDPKNWNDALVLNAFDKYTKIAQKWPHGNTVCFLFARFCFFCPLHAGPSKVFEEARNKKKIVLIDFRGRRQGKRNVLRTKCFFFVEVPKWSFAQFWAYSVEILILLDGNPYGTECISLKEL